MNRIRIAARVASYLYSDGIPYDAPEMHKNLQEIYENHRNRKIDISKLGTVETSPAQERSSQ